MFAIRARDGAKKSRGRYDGAALLRFEMVQERGRIGQRPDLDREPDAYEPSALTNELQAQTEAPDNFDHPRPRSCRSVTRCFAVVYLQTMTGLP